MNFSKISISLATLALLASAASLHAERIGFTWTAVALPDSNVDGQTFSGDIIFTGSSDTSDLVDTGSQNSFESVGPVDFFIPSLNATGTISDTADILSFSSGLLKFNLTPNGVTSDAADLLLSNLGGIDLFDTSQTISGSQFVEAIGTAPVSSAVINGITFSNTALRLDTDPAGSATLVETVGAPEPASCSLFLAGGAFILLLKRATFTTRAPRKIVILS